MRNPSPSSAPLRALTAGVLVAIMAAFVTPTRAQITVAGSVVDDDGAHVSYANVQLLHQADSTLARGTVAGEDGRFSIQSVNPGKYVLYVSLIGYRDHLSPPLVLSSEGEMELEPLILEQQAVEMEEVSVEARRSLYEQKGDRLIVNVGTSLTLVGASALDVLERSPGIIVDKLSNTISMLGKDGVHVMINGKLSYMPADGLVQYLTGMSADNIETIELITSPPAELDAEGNAGYINIVLKRNPDDGLNGSLSVSGGYGEGESGDASGDFSLRTNHVNLFGSYSLYLNGQKQVWSNYRRITDADGVTETPTDIDRDPLRIVHNLRLGIDYQVDDRTTVGAVVAGFNSHWSMNAVNTLSIRTNGLPVTFIRSDNDEINHWRHGMGNMNVRRKLTGSSTVSIDVDHLRYRNNNPTDYLNTSTDVATGNVKREQLESGKQTPLHITAVKADYTGKLGGSWEVGVGVKGSFSRFTNEAFLDGLARIEWAAETGLSSKSSLREDVLAAYGSADYQINESISMKLGLRYEYTAANLDSKERKGLVDRRFGSVFPSVAYSQKLSEVFQVGASYSRRITRPSFGDLAPFLYFLDPYTFFTGNVALQPAIINSVKTSLTVNSLLASVEYSWEDSTIVGFQNRVIARENVQLIYPVNFRGTRSATVLISLPLQLTSWWSTQNNLMGMWTEMKAYQEGALGTYSRRSWRANSTQNIQMPYGLTFELTGFYQSPMAFGARQSSSVWGVTAGLQKALSAKGKLTLAVDDLFDSWKMVTTTGSADDPSYVKQEFDFARTIRLSYSTRFGDGKSGKRRDTASQDESQRAQ